jgi:hypothetical protein
VVGSPFEVLRDREKTSQSVGATKDAFSSFLIVSDLT